MSDAVPDLDLVVKQIAEEMLQRPDRGEVATYIAELGPGRRQNFRPGRDRRRRESRRRRRQRNAVVCGLGSSARLQSGLKIEQIVSADLNFVGAVPKAN
jgi:hypothetical protein